MNKFIYIVLFAAFLTAQIGCSGDVKNTNQSNSINVNAAAATPAPTAANIAVNAPVKETPLPQFTNADEAVAEGNKLLDANSTEKAIQAYKQAVKLNPDSGEAYFRLGIAYAQIEKIAKDKALTAVETGPTPAPAKSKTSQKSKKSKTGKFQPPAPTTDSEKAFAEAVKAYKKFLVKNPKDDAALYNLGRAYNKLNDDDNALKSLQQAVKLKPEDTEYQTELGAILIKLAKYDDAVKALKKALDIDSQNLQAGELLDKAAAGKKRVDFGLPPKGSAPEKTTPVRESPRPKKTSAPKNVKPETKPETPNANK